MDNMKRVDLEQGNPAGNIVREFEEAGKLDEKVSGNANTITVGCGAYFTIICC